MVPIEDPSLGLRYMVDVNFFPVSRSAERQALCGLHRRHEILLACADVLGTELMNATPEKREELLADAPELHEYFGPAVLGHSRLDHCVFGSDKDAEFLNRTTQMLFGACPQDLVSRDLRDAMHIACAGRYGFTAFITEDQKLLSRNRESQEFLRVWILSPPKALDVALRLQRGAALLKERREGSVYRAVWIDR